MIRISVFLLLAAGLAALPLVPASFSHGEIPRFMMMADGLYRGGQPSDKGFQLLKERGIKTIINLRMENDESGVVGQLGMNYVHIPIEDVRPWTRIPPAAVAKYFELINNPANYPIFFHCRRGADRTGAMAALYRIAIERWDAATAYSEARHIGMRSWYVGLKTQLYDFRPVSPSLLQPGMQAR
jgi:protein tyrosine phosphatase (PTP) superfamily phosphohydrolase (DUF442 family)